IGELVMGTNTLAYQAAINKMLKWSRKEIISWQEKKLQLLINHAYNNTQYYRNLFDINRIKPQDIQTIADLEQIPKLTKEIIRENFQALTSVKNTIRYRKASTGGSMGDPLRFLVSNPSWSFINAFKFMEWEKIGYRLGDNHIALGSSSLFPREKRSIKHDLYYLLKGKISVNGITFTNDKYLSIVKMMTDNKVKYLYGYAAAIYLFAEFVRANRLDLPYLKGVITTSEILLPEYYSIIKEAFNVPVLDAYGAADGGISAYKLDDGLFEVGYNAIAQIENRDISQHGPLLTTDLLNYAFPFIRYELGDEVSLSQTNESVFNGQVFSKVLGRTPDVMRFANGRTLTGPGFTILLKDFNVYAYRLYSPNDKNLVCEIQKSHGFSVEEETKIRESLEYQAGENVKVDIHFKDSFEPLPNGKRNYFMIKV
ncbi:MAG: hypothetical protein LC102_03685, partial [Ignavibacteriales bacterium]|nr:hypothetical protein [Ignavibacteriales bacterium]